MPASTMLRTPRQLAAAAAVIVSNGGTHSDAALATGLRRSKVAEAATEGVSIPPSIHPDQRVLDVWAARFPRTIDITKRGTRPALEDVMAGIVPAGVAPTEYALHLLRRGVVNLDGRTATRARRYLLAPREYQYLAAMVSMQADIMEEMLAALENGYAVVGGPEVSFACVPEGKGDSTRTELRRIAARYLSECRKVLERESTDSAPGSEVVAVRVATSTIPLRDPRRPAGSAESTRQATPG